MKMVMFDLGKTLEDNDILYPGAQETLQKIQAMRDAEGNPVILALISDYYMPSSDQAISVIQQRYYELLELLGIRSYFEPLAERVTLSTEVGVFKPNERIFQAALKKAQPELRYQDVVFITEDDLHVKAARKLGMRAIHFGSSGQVGGEVDQLLDLPRLIEEFFQIPTARAILRIDRTMKLACLRVPSDARKARSDPAGCLAATWAQFGDEVLLFTDQADWGELVGRAGRRRDELREENITVKRDNIHLVVQKGRLFQQEHTSVRVLHDRGRFLVVELDPEQAQKLTSEKRPCYTVRPFRDNQVVFDVRRSTPARLEPVARIQHLVNQVSRERFQTDLKHLTSYMTRLSTSSNYLQAAAWAREQLAMGYLTRLQNVSVNGSMTQNVIADKAGRGTAERELVIVVAHLDSINQQGGSTAPGADDNGSGSAGLLELARIFRHHESIHDLRFVLFGGEEQGLFGSEHYVASLPIAERGRIRSVVNMDMIGSSNNATRSVLLEGAQLSQAVVNGLAESAASYTHLVVQTSLEAWGSDHVPFIDMGIPAVLTIEGADSANSNIHSSNDTVEHIDFDLAQEILRMNAAFIATHIGSYANTD